MANPNAIGVDMNHVHAIRRAVQLCAVVAALSACSSPPLGLPETTGTSTVSPIALPEAAPPEAAPAVPPDAGVSPMPSADAAQEAAPLPDAPPEASSDAAPDSAGDAPSDVQADAPQDASSDVPNPYRDAPCQPVQCGTHSWACWPMPNPARSGLPNAASYTDMGDGTIRDNRTCLLWQKNPPRDTAYTWQQAKDYCTNNRLLAGTGWRLPTRIELMSIVDFSRQDPSIVVSVFPSTLSNPPYWTWSAFAGAATPSSYIVSFHQGAIDQSDQMAMFPVRCVRGNGEDPELRNVQPQRQYEIGVSEVRDRYTGLVWQRDDSRTTHPGLLSWADASAYCASLADGGAWRLPSVGELATLVDETRASTTHPTIDRGAFEQTERAGYWSQTASGQSHWTVGFGDGLTHVGDASAFARCVR
jgi:hypothetical protein